MACALSLWRTARPRWRRCPLLITSTIVSAPGTSYRRTPDPERYLPVRCVRLGAYNRCIQRYTEAVVDRSRRSDEIMLPYSRHISQKSNPLLMRHTYLCQAGLWHLALARPEKKKKKKKKKAGPDRQGRPRTGRLHNKNSGPSISLSEHNDVAMNNSRSGSTFLFCGLSFPGAARHFWFKSGQRWGHATAFTY